MVSFWTRHFILPSKVHREIQSLLTKFPVGKVKSILMVEQRLDGRLYVLPRNEGGLGLKNLLIWNKSQIMSCLWQIITNNASLWATWVQKTLLRNKNFWNLRIPKGLFLELEENTSN